MKPLLLILTITLIWTHSGDCTAFKVYQNAIPVQIVPNWERTAVLEAGTNDTFTVTAYNQYGESGHSNEVINYSIADFDKDGDVDGNDLSIFAREYGR